MWGCTGALHGSALPARGKRCPMYRGGIAGGPLDTREVMKARKQGFENFKEMQVYEQVPRQEARDGGHQVLGLRWVGVKPTGRIDRV